MAVRRLADEQPEDFAFTPENEAWVRAKIADYPEGRQASAVIPVLWRAQAQHGGWLPEPAIRRVAEILDMPYIRVFEIATFYTMFQLKPVGRTAHVQVCGTTPCMLRGSEDLVAVCRRRIAPDPLTPSEDGAFSWEEVECAGACVNGPMVQIGPDTYEDLTAEAFERILDALAAGERPAPGPQSGRRSSEPITGATTLLTREKDRAGSRGGASLEAANGLPEADLPPTEPVVREQNAGRPEPRDRPEVEKLRTPAGAPPREAKDIAAASPAVLEEGESVAGAKAPAPSPTPDGAPRSTGDDVTPAEAVAATGGETATPETARRDAARAAAEAGALDAEALARADAAGTRPPAFAGAVEADDLESIAGIGPKIAGRLATLGIRRYAQIAAWTETEIAWINAYLGFPGRVERDRWVAQARALAEGREPPA